MNDPADQNPQEPTSQPPASSKSRRGAHLPAIASQGGRAVVEKYGSKHMAEIGRRGARTVVEKYGPEFFSQIGARNKGVKKRRRSNGSAAEK